MEIGDAPRHPIVGLELPEELGGDVGDLRRRV